MSSRQRRLALWLPALGCFVLHLGCAAKQPPVARLTVRPDLVELAWPSFAEIEIGLDPIAELPAGVTAPKLFLHLLDDSSAIVRTFDHPLPEAWRPGREIRYRHRIGQSALAEPLPAGRYPLSVGLYDVEAGRFALATAAPKIGRNEYLVGHIRVPPVGEAAPQARFSAGWLPAEAGTDRQVVVRRTLRAGTQGRVQFGPLAGPGIITFGFFVPNQSSPGSRLELLDSSGQPKLDLVSNCGAEELELSGTGRFDVDFRIEQGFGPVLCEIGIEPNFRLTTSDRAEATSVRLEGLSWRAGPGGEDGTPAD